MSSFWTYLPSRPTGALEVDRDLYGRLGAQMEGRRLAERYVVPIRSGKAWPLNAGQICRVVVLEGPQVADFNCWNRHDPRERFWAARTRQLHRAHVTTYDRLWSTLPFLRPMATIIGDTLSYGIDEDGGRCHDLLGTRCDPYVTRLLTGVDADYHCHSNLTRAVAPYGLTELDVHDVLNIFQVTGLADDRYFMKASPAKKGDYFEILAEIDLLCAISTCPGGDLSVPLWGPGARDAIEVCRPLGVEVYDAPRELFEEWKRAERARPGGSGRAEGAGPRESGRPPRAESEGSARGEEPSAH